MLPEQETRRDNGEKKQEEDGWDKSELQYYSSEKVQFPFVSQWKKKGRLLAWKRSQGESRNWMASTKGSSYNQRIFKYMQQDGESKWITQNSRLERIKILECHVTAGCFPLPNPSLQIACLAVCNITKFREDQVPLLGLAAQWSCSSASALIPPQPFRTQAASCPASGSSSFSSTLITPLTQPQVH